MLSAIAFAREFRTIESIEIGLVFEPDDAAGPMTIADMERIMAIAASPLMLKDGRWIWAGAASASRTFAGADGIIRRGDAAALVDRSEEHTSELQSLMRISYAVFRLTTNRNTTHTTNRQESHSQHYSNK